MKLEFKKNTWYYRKDWPRGSDSALMYIKTTEKEFDSYVCYKEIIYSGGKFKKINSECRWDNELEIADMKEVSKYLPEGHPDKVSGKILNKFNIGDIIVSTKEIKGIRIIGDIFTVLSNSTNTSLYYIFDINSSEPNSFRLATTEEIKAFKKGIKNINDMVTIGDIVVVTEQSRFGNYARLNLVVKLSEIKSDGYIVETANGPSFCENVRKATEEEIRLRFTTSAYKPGDWVTIEDRKNLQSGCTGCPNGTFKVTDTSNRPSGLLASDKDTFIVETNKGYWRISDVGVRPATKEEIEKVTVKTNMNYEVGDWVLLSENANGWGSTTADVCDKVLQITIIELNERPHKGGTYYFGDKQITVGSEIVCRCAPSSKRRFVVSKKNSYYSYIKDYVFEVLKEDSICIYTCLDNVNSKTNSWDKENFREATEAEAALYIAAGKPVSIFVEDDPKLKVGDVVGLLTEGYGYEQGDIGVIELIKDEYCAHVFVQGRKSTSVYAPQVVFDIDNLIKLPDNTRIPDYSNPTLGSMFTGGYDIGVDPTFSRLSTVLGPKLIIDDEEEILFTGISKIKIVDVKLLIN